MIALDGGWREEDGALAWEGLGHLRTSEVGEVLERLVRRMEKYLRGNGQLRTLEDEQGVEGEGDPEGNLAASAVSGRDGRVQVQTALVDELHRRRRRCDHFRQACQVVDRPGRDFGAATGVRQPPECVQVDNTRSRPTTRIPPEKARFATEASSRRSTLRKLGRRTAASLGASGAGPACWLLGHANTRSHGAADMRGVKGGCYVRTAPTLSVGRSKYRAMPTHCLSMVGS
jgi:hypothetical protein